MKVGAITPKLVKTTLWNSVVSSSKKAEIDFSKGIENTKTIQEEWFEMVGDNCYYRKKGNPELYLDSLM